jgi:hypothetical protein
MKRILFAATIMGAFGIARAMPPNENLVKSCLLAQSAAPSVTIQILNAEEITQEDDYADGFNATYMFKHRGADAGYAEGKAGQALIYSGKLYRLSRAVALGDNHGIKPGEFDPTLAQWSIAGRGEQQYFCVSFNFDGLGQSGSFQNVHGGYLLNTKNKNLYFFVRDIKK